MGLKRLSMQHDAVHNRNAVLKNLTGDFRDGVGRHAEKRRIDIPRLSDVGDDGNGSQRLRQLSPRTDGPPYDGRNTEIVA